MIFGTYVDQHLMHRLREKKNQHYVASYTCDVIYCYVIAEDALTLTHKEQIAYIKIEPRRGKSTSEILKALEEVDSGSILGYSTIKRWVREFNNGGLSLATSTCVEEFCQRQMKTMLKM